MRQSRLIPVILIHRTGVYKTQRFKKPTYIGDPLNTIRLFNDLEVDEIIILDIDASKLNTEPNLKLIEELASEAFVPLSYGGGIKSVQVATKILRCGVEKLIINHAIQNSKGLLLELANVFGSASVVATIDYKDNIFGKPKVFDHVTGKVLNKNVIETIQECEVQGAGEILINSVDRDGKMKGLDYKLIKEATYVLDAPLIACGGTGSLDHIELACKSGASAIAAGSFFVYRGSQRGILINYPDEQTLCKYMD